MVVKSMLFRAVEGVLLCVHNANAPSDPEWEDYVRYCVDLPRGCSKTLVSTEGGGPNAKQRNDLQKRYLETHPMTVAVITDATIVRGIVTALNWFNPKTKAFAHAKGTGVQEALAYLGVTGLPAQKVAIELQRMRLELGIK